MSLATAACGVLSVVIWVIDRNREPLHNPVAIPWVTWMAALVLSAAFALDPSASFGRLGKGLFPGLVALGAWHSATPLHRQRALFWLMISAVAAWLYGLGLFIGHGASFPARARGLVGHYMTFAGQIGLIASVAAGIAFVTRGRWRLGAAAVCALGLLTLAATYTRSAWLGFLVSVAVMLGLTRPRGIAALAALALVAYALAPGSFRPRIDSIFDPRHPTNIERTYMWEAGARMLRDHPWTGVGLQDLKPIYERYRAPAARERAGHLHSIPVQIAATMGIPGLIAFVLLYAGIVRCALAGLKESVARARAEGGDAALAAGLRLGVLGGLAGFAVAGLFEWNFGDEELLYPLYLLAGMAWAARPTATAPR
jgi:O-antigen ligase